MVTAEITPPRYDLMEGREKDESSWVVVYERLRFEEVRSLLPLQLGQWIRVSPGWRP